MAKGEFQSLRFFRPTAGFRVKCQSEFNLTVMTLVMTAELLLWQQVAGVHQGCNKARNKAVGGVEDGTEEELIGCMEMLTFDSFGKSHSA